jgi:hypothetical protein
MNRAEFMKSLLAIGLVPPTLAGRWIAEAEAADSSRPLEGAATAEIDRHRIAPISVKFQADATVGPFRIVFEVADVDAAKLRPAYLTAKVVEVQIDVGGARFLADMVVTELRQGVAWGGMVGPAKVVLAAVGEAIVEPTA